MHRNPFRLLVSAWVLWIVAMAVLLAMTRSSFEPAMPSVAARERWPVMVPQSPVRVVPATHVLSRPIPPDRVTDGRVLTGDHAVFARPGRSMRVVAMADGDQELGQEIKFALERVEPQNRGRERTFGRLRWPLPTDCVGPLSLRRQGWTLIVIGVERRPGGWDATVHVGLRVSDGTRANIPVLLRHLEIYQCRDNHIILASEIANRDWQPGDGFPWGFF
jgi:hypothetical protein